MDIRKKGAICMIIYNIWGTLAICSIYPSDPLYNDWWLPIEILTFPVTIISFAYRYGASEPLYPVFIIQFIMLIITVFLLDLILREYSPKYIEKKKVKDIARREKAFSWLVTEQLAIYLKYSKEIDDLVRMATPEEKAILSVEQWHSIDNLVSDVLLIKKGQVSQSTINSIGKRIKEKLKDQAAMDLLLTIE